MENETLIRGSASISPERFGVYTSVERDKFGTLPRVTDVVVRSDRGIYRMSL